MNAKRRSRTRKPRPKKNASKQRSVWTLSNDNLTPKQRLLRERALEALSLTRREKHSQRKAAIQVGLELETVIANTNAFRKVYGRWRAKKTDHIPTIMVINEKGRKRIIEVADSRVRSLIGEYHNAVRHFLDTGKSSFLREFRKARFKDRHGQIHVLETRPHAILRIKAREPTPEFFEIYHR